MKRPSKDEATRWFTQAEDEFADADELRKRGRLYLALFHFQQAAEKALKAYLYLKTKSIEVFCIRSLDDLLKIATETDRSYIKVRRAKNLDRYYIPTRYPNGLPGGVPSKYFDDPKEAEETMLFAKEVIDLVKREFKDKQDRTLDTELETVPPNHSSLVLLALMSRIRDIGFPL